jgi:hypothetical protein
MNQYTGGRLEMSSRVVALLLAVGGCAGGAALGQVTQNAIFVDVPSYKRLPVAGNAQREVNHTVSQGDNGVVTHLVLSGTLQRVTGGTYPSEASIRARRFIRLAPNINLLTNEMIIQPFATTTFPVSGSIAIPPGSLVIPVALNPAVTSGPSGVLHNEPGFWEFTFFEQFDDNSADAGTTPDATWTALQVSFQSNPVDYSTPAPVIGDVSTTTRYNVVSDDTLGAGPFTGTIVSNLARPASTPGNRIRHVRVSGYLTGLTNSTLANAVSTFPVSDMRLRLVRTESVLLNPNDLSPLTQTHELFVTVPSPSSSSQRFVADFSILDTDPFGSLQREILQTAPNESYNGFNYFLNAYENIDDPTSSDNVWNGLKVEFFTRGQPPASAIEIPLPPASPPGSDEVSTGTGTMVPGQALWFRFSTPFGASAANGTYLDIDLEGTTPTFDSIMGVYSSTSPNTIGARLAFDDDDGGASRSALSFGSGTARPVPPGSGDYDPRDGRDGTLAPGDYWVAVSTWVTGTGSQALGLDNFRATNPGTLFQPVTLNIRRNAPLCCGLSDVAGANQSVGADGVLTADDIIVFLSWYFASDSRADVAGANQNTTPDGQFTADDIIVFLGRYFAGC